MKLQLLFILCIPLLSRSEPTPTTPPTLPDPLIDSSWQPTNSTHFMHTYADTNIHTTELSAIRQIFEDISTKVDKYHYAHLLSAMVFSILVDINDAVDKARIDRSSVIKEIYMVCLEYVKQMHDDKSEYSVEDYAADIHDTRLIDFVMAVMKSQVEQEGGKNSDL